ncbi:hypothetical protein [Nocardia phage P3.1]|nr:hypothetical protein [Nocardia phage P3.1]
MGKVPANLRASIGGTPTTPSYLERLAAKHREELTPLTAVAVILVDNKGNVALGSLIGHNGYDPLDDAPIVTTLKIKDIGGASQEDAPLEWAIDKFLEA